MGNPSLRLSEVLGHILNSLFLTKRILHSNEVLPINVQFNGQTFIRLSESCLLIHVFWLENEKICFFEEKWF